MNRMIFQMIALAGLGSYAQASELYFQDFSTQGSGYTTSVTEFIGGSGNSDYFTQTDGSTIWSAAAYNGADGSFFAGMDLDGLDAGLPLSLTTSTFDITGATDLRFMIDLAEDDEGSNQDWDAPDYVKFQYRVDGGSWIDIFAAVNDGSTFNSAAFVNGVEITDTFSTFSADLTGVSGTSMAIRALWQLDSGDEDLAIDNITLEGTIAMVPLPLAAITGLGLLGALSLGRRLGRR